MADRCPFEIMYEERMNRNGNENNDEDVFINSYENENASDEKVLIVREITLQKGKHPIILFILG